jgi:hypothetical protein
VPHVNAQCCSHKLRAAVSCWQLQLLALRQHSLAASTVVTASGSASRCSALLCLQVVSCIACLHSALQGLGNLAPSRHWKGFVCVSVHLHVAVLLARRLAACTVLSAVAVSVRRPLALHRAAHAPGNAWPLCSLVLHGSQLPPTQWTHYLIWPWHVCWFDSLDAIFLILFSCNHHLWKYPVVKLSHCRRVARRLSDNLPSGMATGTVPLMFTA